jgi:hypothetical protein
MPSVPRFIPAVYSLVFSLVLVPAAGAVEVGGLLRTLQAVGPQSAGSGAAAIAWKELARADADQLPAILAALDGANPLAANWIRSAAGAIVERAAQNHEPLPLAELEKFLADRRHVPGARRVAYEWIVEVEPAKSKPLLAGMLDDPSVQLRHDAVALRIDEADALLHKEQKAQAKAMFHEALAAANDLDQVRLLAGRLKPFGETVDVARHLGFLLRWRLIGPFDNTATNGFAAVYPPEQAIEPARSYPGKHGQVKWMDYATSDDLGKVDLNNILGEEKAVIAYAACEFQVAKPRAVELRMNTTNAAKVWLNGRLLHRHAFYHDGVAFDQYVMPCSLRPGRNVILLKVCQNEQTEPWAKLWDFQLRICDKNGTAVPVER